MTVTTTLDIRRVSPAIGAEVLGLDSSQPLPDETIAAIRAAWLEHLVLFFPGQELTPEHQVALAERFGEVTEGHPVEPSLEGHSQVLPIDSAKDHTNFWHTDVTFVARPPTGSFLYAVTLPEVGGDTTVAIKDMYGLQGNGFLKMLYDHMTQYEFVCRYRWQPGTLAFWDNRATMHYGIYDYGAERRVMHRVTLRGDRPYGLVPVA